MTGEAPLSAQMGVGVPAVETATSAPVALSAAAPAAQEPTIDHQAQSAGATDNWLARVKQDLTARQYAVQSPESSEAPDLLAHNPRHRFRTVFTDDGVALESTNPKTAWSWQMLLTVLSLSLG